MDNWIKRRRAELKLTQEQVTARLGVNGLALSRSTYGHWETGKYNPPLHDPNARQALANALELDVKEMLVIAGYEVAEEENEVVMRIAIIASKLPEDLQRHALEYLKILEKQAKAAT